MPLICHLPVYSPPGGRQAAGGRPMPAGADAAAANAASNGDAGAAAAGNDAGKLVTAAPAAASNKFALPHDANGTAEREQKAHGKALAACTAPNGSAAAAVQLQRPVPGEHATSAAEGGSPAASSAEAAAQRQRQVLGFNLLQPTGMDDARKHHPSPVESANIDVNVQASADGLAAAAAGRPGSPAFRACSPPRTSGTAVIKGSSSSGDGDGDGRRSATAGAAGDDGEGTVSDGQVTAAANGAAGSNGTTANGACNGAGGDSSDGDGAVSGDGLPPAAGPAGCPPVSFSTWIQHLELQPAAKEPAAAPLLAKRVSAFAAAAADAVSMEMAAPVPNGAPYAEPEPVKSGAARINAYSEPRLAGDGRAACKPLPVGDDAAVRATAAARTTPPPPPPDGDRFEVQGAVPAIKPSLPVTSDSAAARSIPPPPPSHLFSISPDACTNPSLYFLGTYADGKFDLATATGPFRVDLGDIFFAPNIMVDMKVGQRHISWSLKHMWGVSVKYSCYWRSCWRRRAAVGQCNCGGLFTWFVYVCMISRCTCNRTLQHGQRISF